MPIDIGKFFWSKKLRSLSDEEQVLATDYHRLFYGLWKRGNGTLDTSWMGWRVVKSPNDLWVYQEIVAELKPTVIIETGTRFGGSAAFFASLFDSIGAGRVVTIDVDHDTQGDLPQHPRIKYVTGLSCDASIVSKVRDLINVDDRVMVILDSDHSYANVIQELNIYSGFVTPGQYLVCEDTNLNGHPVREDFGPGPAEAVAEFMAGNEDFAVDTQRERFLFSVAPGGFLKRSV